MPSSRLRRGYRWCGRDANETAARRRCSWIDAGGSEILQGATNRALGGFEIGHAVTGIDQDQLAAGVDELRVERHRYHALGHVGGISRSKRLVLWDIGHERIGQRERARTVVDRGAFL